MTLLEMDSNLTIIDGEEDRNVTATMMTMINESSFTESPDSVMTTSITSGSSSSPQHMSPEADVSWTVVFSLMIACALIGNTVVFWIVLAHRRMQNVTNYFLVNLSLADIMMSCLNTVFNFIFMKNRNWTFGSVYCTINNFIAYLSVAVSVFTLMAISIDRYIAIVRPLQPRMSKTCARIILLAIWSGSSALSLPALLYSHTWTFNYSGGRKRTVCFLLWPDGPPTVSELDYIYNIVYFLLTYMVPIVAMGICYGRIGSVLWGRKNQLLRENACNDLARQRKLHSKRKVVKMFIVVVIIFAVCWFPYHAYFIYTYHDKEIIRQPFIQHVYLGFYWLAMSNAMFNPLVYYWMNARFRAYFLSLVGNVREVLCYPKHLLGRRRADSKSSLDIGVVPTRRRGVNLELTNLKCEDIEQRRQQNHHRRSRYLSSSFESRANASAPATTAKAGVIYTASIEQARKPKSEFCIAAPANSRESSSPSNWKKSSAIPIPNGGGGSSVGCSGSSGMVAHPPRSVAFHSNPIAHETLIKSPSAQSDKSLLNRAQKAASEDFLLLRVAAPFRNNPVAMQFT